MGNPESSSPGDKPAIAVLPFEVVGDEPAYLGDAIAEEVITTLSRIPQLRVIARGSSFQYRTSVPDLRTIADELGVRYVLQGSVRAVSDRVRVTAHLGDVATGEELWSERYDRSLDDVFALQDEISEEIATTLEVKLGFGEQVREWRRGGRSLAAYEHFAYYLQEYLKFSRHANIQARREALAALELDPGFPSAHVALASTYATEVHLGWTDDREESLRLAKDAVQHAFDIDPAFPEANALLGRIYMLEGDYDAAVATTGKALEDLPNYAYGYHIQAMNLLYAGRFVEAVEADRQIFLLSPLADVQNDNARLFLAAAYCHLQRFDDALEELDQVLTRRPTWQMAHAHRIVVLVGLGRAGQARDEARSVLQINPRFSTAWFATLNPYQNEADLNAILDPLRAAGLPDRPGDSDLVLVKESDDALSASERTLATVLFTDIVSSTKLAAQLGDRRWRETLDAHDEMAGAAVEAHGGRVVKSTGDGIHAIFPSPGDAIRCAQEVLTQAEGFGFRLRAGVHTGEVEIRDQDVAGIAVHIAARITSSAQPDEILLSRTVKDLVAGSEFDLASKGFTELRGVPDQQELFSLRV